jgi:nitronate monooxygenase
METLLQKLGIRFPVFQAPMAGGPDTPALAAAVSEAGGLGALGCGYLSPEGIEATVAQLRQRTTRPFALNLFVREEATDDPEATTRVESVLAGFRRELGLLPTSGPRKPPPSYSAQVAAVVRARPAVVSFTFGMPSVADVRSLHDAGIFVIGTATCLDEAETLASAGLDAVCAQGAEAGGHRGTFLWRVDHALIGTMALTRQLVTRLRIPVIAAGGIMDGAGVRAALALGAAAVQLGTAFMLCPEAGTHPAHRAALKSPAAHRTVVTSAFSGRAARGVSNRFSDAFEKVSPAPFPQQQELTAELRAAAAAQGRADLMQLWAGQGVALIREMPAGDLVRVLVSEAGLPST